MQFLLIQLFLFILYWLTNDPDCLCAKTAFFNHNYLKVTRILKLLSLQLVGPGAKKFAKFWWHNWYDRCSRRVFLCFYLAIFQLTSAKFQTFAYNLRTVASSYMKLWQQFEINELHVCTKFRGNKSHDFGFRTRKPLHKFGVKSGLSQKRLN